MGKSLKFALTLLLLLAMLVPPGIMAAMESMEGTGSLFTFPGSKAAIADAKLSPEVKDALEDGGPVEVLIMLTEQANTANAAAATRLNLPTGATPYRQKMARRFAVVETLQETAARTQAPMLKYLAEERARGTVDEFQSFYVVNIIYARAEGKVIRTLSKRPDVKLILPNSTVELMRPHITAETGLLSGGIEWNIEHIGAPAVWDQFGLDGTGVVVGIIDTGVDGQHPALKEKWRGYNPDDPGNPDLIYSWYDPVYGHVMPFDFDGHGTHVTGTILGAGPAGTNRIGVAPGARWIAANAFEVYADGKVGASQLNLLKVGQYMLAPFSDPADPINTGDPSKGPDIINNSWGLLGHNEWYRGMVQNWRNAGILPVFAAGNDGSLGAGKIANPAHYPESLAVAATNSNNQLASFSSRGPANYPPPDDLKPDISAPGVSIRSAVPGGGYQGGWNGTSMASPHIAGVAALLLSADASLSVDQLEEIMIETSIPLTNSNYPTTPNYGYGHGLVSAFNAVGSYLGDLGLITGWVVEDLEPPVIEHDPLESAYRCTSVILEARLTDNIALMEAEVRYSPGGDGEWYSAPLEIVSGDYRDGTYRAVIPGDKIRETGLEYYIRAIDRGDNTVTTKIYNVGVHFGFTPGSWDFDEYPEYWSLDGDWKWGAPAGADPQPAVGGKLIGTALGGNYSENIDSWLVTPPLDPRGLPDASLRLNHWYDLAAGDFGYVLLSADCGETWEVIELFTGSSEQEWRNIYIDLSDYTGSEKPVRAAFVLESAESGGHPGWYIDNVHFVGEDNEPPGNPTDLAAASGEYDIELTWRAPEDLDVAGYNVYRKIVGEEEYDPGPIGSSKSTAYRDLVFQGGVEYFYIVRTYDYAGNESEDSNEASIFAPDVTMIHFSVEEAAGLEAAPAEPEVTWVAPARPTGQGDDGLDMPLQRNPGGDTAAAAPASFHSNRAGLLDNPGHIPLNAVITVLETGQSVRTALGDGSFRLHLPFSPEGENWTLRVESYGYYPMEHKVTLAKGEALDLPLVLNPLPRGAISGKAVNLYTGTPVAGAYVRVMEDEIVGVYITESDGLFLHQSVPEGSYTVRFTAAGYHQKYVPVEVTGGETSTMGTIELLPFLYTITVSTEPVGGGNVTGSGPYYRDESVTVTAEPGTGYNFVNWTEYSVEVSTDEEYTFNAESDRNLVANFTLKTYTVEVGAAPQEGGSVTGGGTYTHGDSVTVQAIPKTGYQFINWTVDGVEVSDSADYTFTATADRDMVANFARLTVTRLSGAGRYDTAVAVSLAGWPNGADTVLLARGDDFPDSLAGVSLAYALDAPILLTPTNRLSRATRDEIERLNPERVIILGGASAISDSVETELREQMDLTVERLSGANRFETAAKIAERLTQERGGSTDMAFIALGHNFPDALAAASYGAVNGYPILLSLKDTLTLRTGEAITGLSINSAVISGGSSVISDEVKDELINMGLSSVERISGRDRYATSVELAKEYLPTGTDHLYIATGTAFPDALSGAVLAAQWRSGVLLVRGDLNKPNEVVQEFVMDRGITAVTIFGGEAAVSTDIEEWFRNNLN